MYKLALIVPIYDALNYFGKFIESIRYSLPDKVLLICVDDGCPANTLDVAKIDYPDFFNRSNVFCLRTENKGVAEARNTGVEITKKHNVEYFSFADADDVLSSNYFSIVLELLDRFEPDVVEFDFVRFFQESNSLFSNEGIDVTYSGCSMDRVVDTYAEARWHLCRRIFRSQVFDSYNFVPSCYFEDMIYCLQIYSNDFRLIVISNKLYGYRRTPNSITQSFSVKRVVAYRDSFLIAKNVCVPQSVSLIRDINVLFTAAGYGIYLGSVPSVSKMPLFSFFKNKKIIDVIKILLFLLLPKLYIKLVRHRRGIRHAS